MPERPKRRKNNKNKRKNKNNRPDINQNNEKTESLSSESCSEHKIEAKLSEDLTVLNQHINTQISDDQNVVQESKCDDVEENCSALLKTCLDSHADNLVVTKETETKHCVENVLSETCEEIKKKLKYGGGDHSEDILSNIINNDDGFLKEIIKIRSDINLSQENKEQVKSNTKYEEHVTCSEKMNDEKRTTTNDGCINYENISSPESENIGLDEKQVILNKDCTILTLVNISSSEINKQKGDDNQVMDIEKNKKINKYIVESPDQTLKSKSKLINTAKSKSLDNDDVPKIIDVTEECDYQAEDALVVVDTNNVVISDIDSDVEWEQANELQHNQESDLKNVAAGEFSISTLPLNVAKCDETKSLTPEEEISLRHYLQTLNLSTNPSNGDSVEFKAEIEHIISREIKHRLRKKGLAEDFFCQRGNAPRILDVIDEEGSGESSLASRRQSYLSDKKSDAEDLDDVFEENNKVTVKTIRKNDSQGRVALRPLVPQPCLLVGTKIKDPEISEACGNWTVKTLEKMKGAELIYLTDSSSSTSSIHDVNEETDDSADTDLSVRMITPTIEVTDTENLLKKTFLTSDYDTSSIKNNDNTQNLQDTVLNEKHSSYSTKNLNNQNDSMLQNDNSHVIEILQTDNIKTNLYVKGLEKIDLDQFETSNITKNNSNLSSDMDENIDSRQKSNEYSCEMKILKCELNDAINNLIKEVVSDSETNNDNENIKDTFARQDSSSSICSSQCTAKYNPTSASLNDISNILHDENFENNLKDLSKSESISHVKDVFEHVIGIHEHNKNQTWAFIRQPLTLKDLCLRKISTLPYGEKILEELANVSKRLQNVTIFGSSSNTNINMTDQVNNKNKEYEQLNTKSRYPLSDVSTTEKVSLHTTHKHIDPPPVKPRNSSLKKSQDDHHWAGYPTKSEPVYICLSPSQKMLMEKTNTIVTKEEASHLVDIPKKPVDRKDYNQGYEHKELLKTEDNKTPPNIPFKSQTGSRLLALIRDPSVVNSAIKYCDFSKRSLDQLNKSHIRKERLMEQNSERLNIFKDVATFKPIPPPRPRKISSSIYESDESSDFTDSSFRSIRSAKKMFHYSTGNLNKEIENDISSIQNMHRYCTNIRDDIGYQKCPRRPSLPKDLCDQQMEYIRQKEKEVEAELRRLEEYNSRLSDETGQRKGPKAPMLSDKDIFDEKLVDFNNCFNLRKKETLSFSSKPFDMEPRGRLSSLFSSSQEEITRDKMYSEYVNEMAERQERKQKKVIKITNTSSGFDSKETSKSMPTLDILDSKVNNRIEKEFISKARERWNKLGIKDPETEDEREEKCKEIYKEPKVIEHKIKVIEDGQERDVKKLPNHLQEFVHFTVKEKDQGLRGSPGESKPGPASPHVVILCAVIIIMLTVGKYLMRIFRNK